MSRPIDRSTVNQWVVDNLPAALRVAKRLVYDAEAAEEVVQEALCRILQRWQSYRGEAAFSTWMLQIVVNVAREQYRNKQRRPAEFRELNLEHLATASETAEQQTMATELGIQIRAAIDGLPDRQREVALLKFGDELKTCEIAAILQISEANVHACIHLVRKHIAKLLDVDYLESK